MAIFLDTGFFLALVHEKDPHHALAVTWLDRVRSGEWGHPYTSTLVMAEAATLVTSRTRGNPVAIERMMQLFSGECRLAQLIRLTRDEEEKSWRLLMKIASSGETVTKKGVVSYVDCTIIVACQERNIERVASFDEHFVPWLQYP